MLKTVVENEWSSNFWIPWIDMVIVAILNHTSLHQKYNSAVANIKRHGNKAKTEQTAITNKLDTRTNSI